MDGCRAGADGVPDGCHGKVGVAAGWPSPDGSLPAGGLRRRVREGGVEIAERVREGGVEIAERVREGGVEIAERVWEGRAAGGQRLRGGRGGAFGGWEWGKMKK